VVYRRFVIGVFCQIRLGEGKMALEWTMLQHPKAAEKQQQGGRDAFP
jgi:hypothetical protein